MRRRSKIGAFKKPAGRLVPAWAVLAALILNLLWPTTLVVASAADPATAIFFAPICSSSGDAATSDGMPAKAPAHAIHCPLCVIAGSQLTGPVPPILILAAPSPAGMAQAAPTPEESPASLLIRPQQARAPPLSA